MTKAKTTNKPAEQLPEPLQRLAAARHDDPFSVLGRQPDGKEELVRIYLPDTAALSLPDIGEAMQRVGNSDFFEWHGEPGRLPQHYRLEAVNGHGEKHVFHDPYAFAPCVADFDLYLFSEGRHWHIWKILGAHPHTIDGIDGVLFAVWAPNAARVSVVGDFNHWDGRLHPMRHRPGGVWELFIPSLASGSVYKFEVLSQYNDRLFIKTDPYANQFEVRPATAAIVTEPDNYTWQDEDWVKQRHEHDWLHEPLSIYEVHLGSWRRDADNNFLNYRELAHELVAYVQEMGFTHIELLPVCEHPFDGSWGYQTMGYYAPTSRFGTPDDFRYFVDYCHQHGIGVLLDWVPAHFPKDAHGLSRFDGTALYEHEDPRRGEHRDWDTLIFNYGRHEVKNFLFANAMYWLEAFHIDGLRVDAVASMIYLDYSREAGDWLPNRYGGRENLEAIEFLRELNTVTHEQYPGTMIMAEESTDWPMVSRPIYVGGLGFSMKWNMGWMHDVLDYMRLDPIFRTYHHNSLTFGLLYAFNENFILPFSHDEVVHGKSSLLYKMSGDEWQRFANLRLLYAFQFTHPGKQLIFMGCEFGQGAEWDHDRELDWYLLDYPLHAGLKRCVADLNHLNREHPALHADDFTQNGFEWIDCHDSSQSVLSYLRRGEGETLIALFNFTPIPRYGYRIGVDEPGYYQEIFNSDSGHYAGSNLGNGAGLDSQQQSWMGRAHSIVVTLPPLAAVILKRTG
ncbi:MAG: 1,4-alpha-glucan branching protein GlgB [Granulosicoccaceae bacterium]|jgi:1,4-alpha-glucan branching enzyme